MKHLKSLSKPAMAQCPEGPYQAPKVSIPTGSGEADYKSGPRPEDQDL